MSDAKTTDTEMAATRVLLRGLAAEARSGGVFWGGGRDWERIRLQAFRWFVLRPLLRGSRACLRALARRS